MPDTFAFTALPYTAISFFLAASIWRWQAAPLSVPGLAAQFLEARQNFWGSLPFQGGILLLFLGHLLGFLIPGTLMAWNGEPVRLLVLETLGVTAGMLAGIGLVVRLGSRLFSGPVRARTSLVDLAIELALLFEIVTGLWIALDLRWGSAWYGHVVAPYLWSVFTFAPEPEYVAGLPTVVRLHIAGGWVTLALFNLVRLIYLLLAPMAFVLRPSQLVIWNRPRAASTGGGADA